MDAPTRWLTDEEQETWQAYLLSTRLLFEALDRQLQTEAGMAHSHYAILVTLADAPNRSMRMAELAARLNFSQSRVTHANARLERDGWVERTQCATDRRGQFAALTESGLRTLETVAPGHVAEVRRRVFDQLSPDEVRSLGEICRALLRGYEDCQESPDEP